MDVRRISGLAAIALGVAFFIFAIHFMHKGGLTPTEGSGLRLLLLFAVILVIAGIIKSFTRIEKPRKHPSTYSPPSAPPRDDCDMQQKIAKRAYELYESRGCIPGHENEDWFQAEKEIREQFKL